MAKLREGEFAKYHGLGNDYLVVDGTRFGARLTPKRVRALCERNRGPGADGIVELVPSRRADIGVRIHNPDGSRAEKSGNGLRIFARALYDLGYTRRKELRLETPGGIVEAELLLRNGAVDRIRVEMGRASFASREIPVMGPAREVLDEPLRLAGESLRITCVSVGNPHCVVFVPELSREALLRLGPALEQHPLFPKRINVQLARVVSRRTIDVLVWERGAGETQSSGSSSCAVAAAAHRLGHTGPRVSIRLPGGTLPVEVAADFSLRLVGPATPVYRGRLL
jgi:diaminopimelate epimerase